MTNAKRSRTVPPALPEPSSPVPRPAWQRVGIGAIALVLGWLPLSAGAGWTMRRVVAAYVPEGDEATSRAAFAALPAGTRAWLSALHAGSSLGALALAALLAGVLLGRLEPEKARRDAALAGALTAALAALGVARPMSAHEGLPSWLATAVLVTAVAAGAGAGGALLGRRRSA